MKKGDPKLMQLAIDTAALGMTQGAGGPFGAVIAREGEIISRGHNCVLRDQDPTAHAEVTAIRLAAQALGQFDLSGCEIYVNGMPCPMCMGAIFWARIERIFYACDPAAAKAIGFDDAKFYEELKKPPHTRDTPCIQMVECVATAEQGYQAWLSKSDRTPY